MTFTALLLMLKLLHVAVVPLNPLAPDDQTLATCVVRALTERPSPVMVVDGDLADVTVTVTNAAKRRLHVIGTVTKADGTRLIEVNHVQHGFNHSLCKQAEGLLEEMADKLAERHHE